MHWNYLWLISSEFTTDLLSGNAATSESTSDKNTISPTQNIIEVPFPIPTPKHENITILDVLNNIFAKELDDKLKKELDSDDGQTNKIVIINLKNNSIIIQH